MRAEPDGRGGTVLPLLAGEGPLALRRTRAVGDGAHVTVVGAMSAPLGGDRLRIEAEVAAGARLTVGASAATVSLPGPHGERAGYEVRLRVGEGAVLRWLPEPVIAARGSDLRTATTADIAPGGCLVLREEQVLGRHAEPSGRLEARLTVRHAGADLLDQELRFGPGTAPGWAGPAVLGGHRAVGQLLLAAPEPVLAAVLASADEAGTAVTEDGPDGAGLAALTPLAGPALLATALAVDGRRLRRLLDAYLALFDAAVRSW
ncbi:urease accessory protein UreD [Actinacidiphila yeochonensis]|uniref:urease accessory protein UreD n=1 Tax=Actinacidiphila yeochonensis TaxID=89050 RepID=UPI000691A163|nr:urease accessory protein UreD [Actinacidiphila yeochonensis]